MHKNHGLLLATAVLLASWQAISSLSTVDSGTKEASCYYGPTAMTGQVPNPNGCNTYFMCYEDFDGTPTYAKFNCSMGHEGMLFWNFRKCQCEHKENAECFTGSDADLDDYFICTCPQNSAIPFPDCLNEGGDSRMV